MPEAKTGFGLRRSPGLSKELIQLRWIAASHHSVFSGNDFAFYQFSKGLIHRLLPFRRSMLKVNGYFVNLAFAD
jgi:hypothetical protein